MNLSKRHCIALLITLVLFLSAQHGWSQSLISQPMITGPSEVVDEKTVTYTYRAETFFFVKPKWTAVNGTVIKQSLEADQITTSATVRWHTPGPGSVSLKEDLLPVENKNVMVTTVPCSGSAVPGIPQGQKDYMVVTGVSQTLTLTPPSDCSSCYVEWSYFDYPLINVHNGDTYPVTTHSQNVSYTVRSVNPTTYCVSPSRQVNVHVFGATPPQIIKEEIIHVKDIQSRDQLEALTTSQKTTSAQYIDGLGRSTQTVVQKGSPAGFDIVQHMEYDAFGRAAKSFLPHVSSSTTGAYQTNPVVAQTAFYNNSADLVADDSHPFASSVFDNSPLGRLTQQSNVGAAWQPGTNHTNRVTYGLNSATDNIRIFETDGTSSSFYAANALFKVTTLDENGNATIVFSDKAGRTILKKEQLNEALKISNASTTVTVDWLETYHIYDEWGRIKLIVSPKGTYALQTNSWTLSTAILDEYVHQFIYDKRGRVIERKTPGQAKLLYCYDKYDRLVLTQDDMLRDQNKWLFVKYDIKNRPVLYGIYKNISQTTRAAVQTMIDGLYTVSHSIYPESARYEKRGSVHGHTNVSFPKLNSDNTSLEIWSALYYDNYNFDNVGGDDYNYSPQGLTGEGTTGNPTGRPTGSKKLVLNSSPQKWISTYVYYDKFGNVIQVLSNNHLRATMDNRITTVYDFDGRPLRTKTSHNAGILYTVYNSFIYDAKGRITEVRQTNPGQAEQVIANYVYNELGQLVDKKLHKTGTNAYLQSVDYRYNIRGWLTSINDSKLTSVSGEQPDYFGMELLYNIVETGLNNVAAFNGNISAVKWKGLGEVVGNKAQRAYRFTYDKNDRMKGATFLKHSGSSWSLEGNALNETVTYDHNGNIRSLSRNRRKHTFNTAGLPVYVSETIDNLTYNYTTINSGALATDELLRVTDASTTNASLGFNNGTSGTANDYVYDDSGNLLQDNNKGIAANGIKYNLLGKPYQIDFANGDKIEYIYDASGTKLQMKVNGTITTDYVGNFVYVNNSLDFFGMPEGRVVKRNAGLEYQYNISDHQGNTRAIFTAATPHVEVIATDFVPDSNGDVLNYPDGNGQLSRLSLFNHSGSPAGSHQLNGGNLARVGVAYRPKDEDGKLTMVFPGDKVKIEAYAKYQTGGSPPSGSFATQLFSAFLGGTPPVIEAGTDAAALNYWGLAVDAGDQDYDPAAPQVFVNIIVFDKDYNFIDVRATQITTDAEQVGVSPDVPHEYMMAEYTVTEPGYVFMYISNNSPVNAYFDNVTFAYTPTRVIQYNEYYPYGFQTASSWTRGNSTNPFLYNAGTELNNLSGFYETMFRNYDPVLGRFLQIDPLAAYASSRSSFAFASNNPIRYNDPLGLMTSAEFDAIVTNLWNSPYGGSWTASEGAEFFANPHEGFESAAAAITSVGGWGNTRYGSEEMSRHALDAMVGVSYDPITGTQRTLVVHNASKGYYQVDSEGNFYIPYTNEVVTSFPGAKNNDLSLVDDFQTALDVFGLVPGFGEVADGINAGLYLARGDKVNASLSAAAMIPFAGWAATSVKFGKKALTNGEIVQKAANKAEKAIGGTGRLAGTKKHSYATSLIDRYQKIFGDRGLSTNHYFNNNAILGPGNRGFLDVLDTRNSIIYDFKFGNAGMSNAQYTKYFNNFGFPIQIIKPN